MLKRIKNAPRKREQNEIDDETYKLRALIAAVEEEVIRLNRPFERYLVEMLATAASENHPPPPPRQQFRRCHC
jgi:hypothetical protein